MGTIKRNFSNNVTPTGKFDSADLTGTIPATNVADASLTNVTSVPASVGDLVQKVASDPTPVGAGDVWYNTTSNALKSVISSEAWSSGSNMITARRLFASSASATQTAAFGAGGYIDGTGDQSSTEEYNGVGFSAGGNIGTARREFDGAGTLTAGLIMGGRIGASQQQSQTEEYNGTSWSEQNDLNTGRQRGSGAGSQTAGLYFSGIGDTDATEEYNGTSWTTSNNLSVGTYSMGGSGTQTAALGCGGNPYRSTTEEYNGTSWTSGGALNTARHALRSAGTQTSSVTFGGLVSGGADTTATEKYDGSSWSTSPATLGTARAELGRAGTASAAFAFGGFLAPGLTSNSEEYNVSTNVITGAAWASGGNYPSNNYGLQGAGSQTAGLGWGGDAAGATTNVTAEYNGSSWTTSGNYPYSGWRIGGDGTQTAAIGSGGVNNGSDLQTATNTYDGSSWTAGTSLPAGRRSHAHVGTTSASLVFAGSPTATTLEYDGSSYSSAPALATPRAGMHGLGTQTAALCGATPPSLATEEYNGTTWTAGGSQVKATGSSAEGNGTGTLNAGMFVAGFPATTLTQIYDGTTFVTSANLGSGGYGLGQSSSSSTAALAFGGYRSGYSNATEEFTGETSAANVVTISSS